MTPTWLQSPKMDRKHKIITSALWAVLVVSMLGVIGGGLWAKSRHDPLPILYDAPAFSLTDQAGKPFASQDLRGKTWIASFIFTHCPGACPKMSAKMSTLQRTVPDPDVHLVSFTVDPERDTPEVLTRYGQGYDADPKRWHFLTGEKQAMFDAAAGMKLSAAPAGQFGPDIVHAEKFLLVDGVGRVRGIYDSNDDEDLKKLAADAANLANRQAGRLF
jgi:protein SCO1/2